MESDDNDNTFSRDIGSNNSSPKKVSNHRGLLRKASHQVINRFYSSEMFGSVDPAFSVEQPVPYATAVKCEPASSTFAARKTFADTAACMN